MPNSEIIKLLLQAESLKDIKRHGWALKGINNAESVAEHVFSVAILTLFLSKDKNLNRDRMIRMALVHDIGESIVGDVVYESGATTIGSLEIKHNDERKAMREIFQNIEDKGEYLSLWEEWAAQKTPEAKFVKLVEKLELAMQALIYEKQGHRKIALEEFWINADKYLKGTELESLFIELKKERSKIK